MLDCGMIAAVRCSFEKDELMINGAMHQEIAGVKYCYRIFENAAGCLGETAGSVL